MKDTGKVGKIGGFIYFMTWVITDVIKNEKLFATYVAVQGRVCSKSVKLKLFDTKYSSHNLLYCSWQCISLS
jgi:hypothetical protein